MNITAKWDTPEKNIIVTTFASAAAWDEIEEGWKTINTMMADAGEWVDMIIDVRNAPGPIRPASFIALVRAYMNAPKNAGTCVLVGASPLARVLAQNVVQSADWHYRIIVADTITEAKMRLSERDTTPIQKQAITWNFAPGMS